MTDERREKTDQPTRDLQDAEAVKVKVKWIKIKDQPGATTNKKVYFYGEKVAGYFFGYLPVPPNSTFQNPPPELIWLKRILECNFSLASDYVTGAGLVNITFSTNPSDSVRYGWSDSFNSAMPETSPSSADGDPEHVLVTGVNPA